MSILAFRSLTFKARTFIPIWGKAEAAVGSASGTVYIVGDASGTFGAAGFGAGIVTLSGEALGAYTYLGSADGTVNLSGEALGTFGLVGSAAGIISISGSAEGVFTPVEVPPVVVKPPSSGGGRWHLPLDLRPRPRFIHPVRGTAAGIVLLEGEAFGSFRNRISGMAAGTITLSGQAQGTFFDLSLDDDEVIFLMAA